MGLVSPAQSNPGDEIDAIAINEPVNQLAAVINGNIDSSNLAAAAVATTNLADGAVTPAKLLASTGSSWAWQSYTPTWTGSSTNPSIGNGTITGKYVQIGKTVICKVEIVAGNTTTFGSGNYSFGLPPVTPKSERFQGSGAALRSGNAFFTGPATNCDPNLVPTTTSMTILQSGGVIKSSTAAWTTGDIFALELSYEAA